MSDSRTLRVVIVGAGGIAAQHADVIAEQPGALLVGVVSRSAERADEFAGARGARGYTSLADAVAAESPDVAVVCTESALHGDAAIDALRHGLHVLVEKPIEVTLERVDDIAAAQREADRVVGVVSQHRFDPATERAQAAIAGGDLGRITSGIVSLALWRDQAYYDSGAWRGTWALDGGGALMNQGIHGVDVLLALMGEAVEVTGFTATLAHERVETEDVAVGAVRFRSGALAVIHATTAAHPGLGVRVQVHGDRGSAVIADDRLTWLGQASVEDAPPTRSLHRQYDDFLAAVRDGRSPRVGIAQNRAAVALITGLYRSAREGHPVALIG